MLKKIPYVVCFYDKNGQMLAKYGLNAIDSVVALALAENRISYETSIGPDDIKHRTISIDLP